jgi:hypothetical protein
MAHATAENAANDIQTANVSGASVRENAAADRDRHRDQWMSQPFWFHYGSHELPFSKPEESYDGRPKRLGASGDPLIYVVLTVSKCEANDDGLCPKICPVPN